MREKVSGEVRGEVRGEVSVEIRGEASGVGILTCVQSASLSLHLVCFS